MPTTRAARAVWAALAAVLLGASAPPSSAPTISAAPAEAPRAAARARMVDEQLVRRGIRDPRVLAAMRAVPRHEFVPEASRREAYDDHPLPIGRGQTISQPYIVALMTELARVGPSSRVLEIGTGSGYQAAVLAELVKEVWSIEIVEPLAREAAERLARLGYENVTVRAGDGYAGWPEHAPFDAILVTAAPPELPEPLVAQLAVGGRLVAPVGRAAQELVVVERTAKGIETRHEAAVRFVPMTGEAQRRAEERAPRRP
jgi:protein-L-isoaspartate(D-aspartate) O-methyltransferase